jgi:drug/metabolite transporter (DMT)-like permease
MNSLWAVFTVVGAFLQTARNAMQRDLTESLGTVGATHVRFLFGFPFALIFLAIAIVATRAALPHASGTFWLWIIAGALTQIGGTALMLLTMTERSFVVSIAYLKTEPIFVALLGFVFLHDPLTLVMAVAILVATLGVVLISLEPAAGDSGSESGVAPALYGLSSGALFAVSAIGYRGAIEALHEPNYIMGASFALSIGLSFQALVLSLYLALRSPAVLRAIVRKWKRSLFAGFTGALASEFWFLAFALAPAANVRTLGLVDVLFAQIASRAIFKQKTLLKEAVGIVLLLSGAVMLVWPPK